MTDGFPTCMILVILLKFSAVIMNSVVHRCSTSMKNISSFDQMARNRFVGNLLKGQTVGVIGAGRIGSAYARMMVLFPFCSL